MPRVAVIQMDAAVVNPRTLSPSLKITPAPRKPMPVMMPWAIRVGSVLIASRGTTTIHWVWYTVTSISRHEARQTKAWVRNPAGRPCRVRSSPIVAPAASAASTLTRVTMSS